MTAPRAPARSPGGWRADAIVVVAALLPLGVLLVRERQIAGVSGFPLDDSWIHLHFARNLVEGAGFSYNPGTPVAGSTAPAWTLLVAAGVALFGSSAAVAKTIGLLATVGAALVTRRAALAWGATSSAALASAVALLWSGPAAWGALSGMEVSLAALLVAAALLAHARDLVAWTAVFAALAVLARPEALLLLPLFALAGPASRYRMAVFALITAALLAPAVWFSLATVGGPVPATASAKVEGGVLGWLAGVHEPLRWTLVGRPLTFIRAWGVWLACTHWLLPLAVISGIWFAWRRGGRARGIIGLALVVHPLGMALLAPYRDPAFQEGRYSIHLLPLAFVVAAVAAGAVVARWRHIVVAAYLLIAVLMLPAAADRYAWGVQNINAMQVHLGRWVDTHLPQTARLAVNDIGAIAYFSRRPIIDLMGLVSPEIIPYRRKGEAGVMQYVAQQCPDYVIVFPAWFPGMTGRGDVMEPIYRVRLPRNEVSGAPEMVVYRLTRCSVSSRPGASPRGREPARRDQIPGVADTPRGHAMIDVCGRQFSSFSGCWPA
jgi:hypothetical protein